MGIKIGNWKKVLGSRSSEQQINLVLSSIYIIVAQICSTMADYYGGVISLPPHPPRISTHLYNFKHGRDPSMLENSMLLNHRDRLMHMN